jgi:hypothetical protein
LAEDFSDVNTPCFFALKSDTKCRMISGLIQVNQLTGDCHEREEKSQNRVVVADKVWEDPPFVLITRPEALGPIRARTVGVNYSSLPCILIQWKE